MSNEPSTRSTAEIYYDIPVKRKFLAGMLLILSTVVPMYIIIAYWPDQLPTDQRKKAFYYFKAFHVRLLPDTIAAPAAATTPKKTPETPPSNASTPSASPNAAINPPTHNTNDNQNNTTADTTPTDTSTRQPSTPLASSTPCEDLANIFPDCNVIHLNTLLMLLVALAGFLGSMIHVASSFTNFVGAEKFKRSWILWYYVKPFTGAALAIIFYFIFRAGLLSFNDPSSINLYGLITLAALTGLFTDKATLKLEEFFTVVFKPKDERPDKIADDYSFASIAPDTVDLTKENHFVITGQKLNAYTFTVTINNQPVPVLNKTDTTISFDYKVTKEQAGLQDFTVSVKNEKGKEVFKNILLPKKEDGAAPAQGEETPPADGKPPTEGGETPAAESPEKPLG